MRTPVIRIHVVSFSCWSSPHRRPACQRSREPDGVSETTFVAVMASVEASARHAWSGLGSPGRSPRLDLAKKRASRRLSWRRRRIQLAQNPARAQTVWQAIERRANDTRNSRRPRTRQGEEMTRSCASHNENALRIIRRAFSLGVPTLSLLLRDRASASRDFGRRCGAHRGRRQRRPRFVVSMNFPFQYAT